MPYSYSDFKQEVKNNILQNTTEESKILDVGIGSGVYSDLLKNLRPNIDGVEIHEPYIQMFNLFEKYNKIYNQNILQISSEILFQYEYFIMGDVVEHLTNEQAFNFIKLLHDNNKKILIGVPYMFEQGIEYNNIYETHLQPDLTEDEVIIRYPMLNTLFSNSRYGYFVNYESPSYN